MAVVTVVIPNYKGIKFIEECLASLYDQAEGTPEYEVLVVDNASDDGSVELIREKFPQTRLICLHQNRATGTLVLRVCTLTDLALATDHRHATRCSRS